MKHLSVEQMKTICFIQERLKRTNISDDVIVMMEQTKINLRRVSEHFEEAYLQYVSIQDVHMICRLVSACLNSPLTSILEHELAQLDRVELTVNQYVNATINAYSNPLSCDRSAPITHNTPLHSRTLCPWEFVNDIDPNRFPPVLTMAKCKCARCFDNYACKPVFYSIHVLQKQCINGSNKWVRRTQLISVACTCSRSAFTQVKKKRLSELMSISSMLKGDVLP